MELMKVLHREPKQVQTNQMILARELNKGKVQRRHMTLSQVPHKVLVPALQKALGLKTHMELVQEHHMELSQELHIKAGQLLGNLVHLLELEHIKEQQAVVALEQL
jgi:hypothetical protein